MSCPEGSSPVEGRCITDVDASAPKPGPDAGACGACPADSPVCDEDAGACVGCLEDTDCGGELSICDAEASACVACTTSEHCEGACDAESHLCIECEDSDDCSGETPLCDDASQCVACLSSDDCTAPGAAVCSEGACTVCGSDADCAGITDGDTELSSCHEGVCVQCTPETEALRCGLNACDPVSFECTGTERESLGTCEACRADSECNGVTSRCVPMTFEDIETVDQEELASPGFIDMPGEPYGHFCLSDTRENPDSCERPFGHVLAGLVSRSGAPESDYCGVLKFSTCDAILTESESFQAQPCLDTTDCVAGSYCTESAEICQMVCTQDHDCPLPGEREVAANETIACFWATSCQLVSLD